MNHVYLFVIVNNVIHIVMKIGKVPFDVVDDPFFTDGFRTAKRC